MSIKEVSVLVKRLPLLTQTNFLDWNLAFQLFAVSLGLGAILWPGLYQFAAPTAVDDTDIDVDTTPVSHNSSTEPTTSKVRTRGRSRPKAASKSSEETIDESKTQNAESHSAVTGEVVFQQTPAVDESLAAARQIVSRQASLVEEAKAIRYAYTVLMSTVSPSLQYLVRCVPYGSLTAAYQAVEQFFIINDNTSRWRMRASFNSLEMQPDEDFLSFCGKIQYMASQINALENKQVIGDSEMTLCLTNGVLRHHNETFYNILTILGRQQGLTFQEAKSQMLPDAHRARNRLADAPSSSRALLATKEKCRNFARGRCRNGDSCSRLHETSSIKCYSCGRQGHVQRNCRTKQNRNAERAHLAQNDSEVIEYVLSARHVLSQHDDPTASTSASSSNLREAVLLFCLRLLSVLFLGVAVWCSLVDSSAITMLLWNLPVIISDLILVSCAVCRRNSSSQRNQRTAAHFHKRSRRHSPVYAPGRRRAVHAHQRHSLPAAPVCPGCHQHRLQPSFVQFALHAFSTSSKGTILDSGATSHLFSSQAFFDVKTLRPSSVKIHLAEHDRYVQATHTGDVLLRVSDSCGSRILRLHNCLLVSELPFNLISLSSLDRLGCRSVSEHGQIQVELDGSLMLIAHLTPDRLYQVSAAPVDNPLSGLKPAPRTKALTPTVDKMKTFRAMIALAAAFGLTVTHLDVKTASKTDPRLLTHASVRCWFVVYVDDIFVVTNNNSSLQAAPVHLAHAQHPGGVHWQAVKRILWCTKFLRPIAPRFYKSVTVDLCITRHKQHFVYIKDVTTSYTFACFLPRKNDFIKVLRAWLDYVKGQTDRKLKLLATGGKTDFTLFFQ